MSENDSKIEICAEMDLNQMYFFLNLKCATKRIPFETISPTSWVAVDIYCHCPCLQLKFQGAWPATKSGSFLKYVFTFKITISFKKTIAFGSPWSLETLDNLPDWSIDFSKWTKNTETVKFWVPTSKPDNLFRFLDNLNCPYFLSTKSFLDPLLEKKVVRHWCEHLLFHKVTFLDTFWREFHWFCLGWTRILIVLF